jgi:hypothetical protein
MFQNNESWADRDVRIVVGIVFTLLALFFLHGVWSLVAAILAAVMFVTAAIGFCPIYALFGLNTSTMKSKANRQDK